MVDSEPASTTFRCQCGAKLKIPATPGRRYACPKCGFKFVAPGSSQPQAPAAVVPTPKPDAQDDSMSNLLQIEQSAEALSPPAVTSTQTCPNCKVQLDATATVCIACGHDLSRKKKHKAARAPGGSVAGKLAIAGGRFTLGCALSAAGALIGAAIWYGVAVATEYEIGIIAWGVGLLAGGGMLLGYGKPSIQAAFIAAVMAAGAILAAKGMIYNEFYRPVANLNDPVRRETAFWAEARWDDECNRRGLTPWADERFDGSPDFFTVYDMSEDEAAAHRAELESWAINERWQDPENVRAFVTYAYASDTWEEETEDEMDEAADTDEDSDGEYDEYDEEWDEEAALAEWSPHFEAATERVAAMSEEQRLEEAKRIDAEDKESYHTGIAGLGAVFGKDKGFLAEMFSPIDAIFVLLALGTAIKVGGGAADEE